MQADKFELKSWPPVRNLIAEHLEVARKTNLIHGMAEADITELNKMLYVKRKEGSVYSLTAFILYNLAQSINKYKQLQAVRHKSKLLVFDDVDITTIVERGKDKMNTTPVGIIIRKAQEKSLEQINTELRQAQKKNPLDYEEVQERRKLLRYPSFVRKFLLRRIHKNPFLQKKYYGTVALTSLVTATGTRSWWGIPISSSPVTVLLSGMHSKVVLSADGLPENRDFLSITFSFNHDTVDGAPSRRFVNELIQNIESGYGLR